MRHRMLTPASSRRCTGCWSCCVRCKASFNGVNLCCRSLCGGGDALGEVAFFTEIAQLEMVRTVSVCRILVVPRIAYNSIAAAFPIGARAILTNLLDRAQEVPSEPAQAPIMCCMRTYCITWSKGALTCTSCKTCAQ